MVVPLAIPDFVVSFGWSSISTWVQGFRGAVLVMTLAVYPLVYLPVAASLRHADPGQEEVARSLGVGRAATFWRVTLRQARRAILGGCLLVALVLLAEYGAFEILGYQTFTTEIFTEFNVSFNVADRLGAVARAGRCSACSCCAARRPRGAGAGVSRSGAARAAREPAASPRARHGGRRSASSSRSSGWRVGVPVGVGDLLDRQAAHPYLTGVSLAGRRRGTPRSTAGAAATLSTLDGAAGRRCWRSATAAGSTGCWSAARISCWRCRGW